MSANQLSWTQVKKHIRKASQELKALAEACYLTLLDPDLSSGHKVLLFSSLIYLLLPVDAVPDFLPGGFADDFTILIAALTSAGKIGKKHLNECRLKHGLVIEDKDRL